MSDAVYLRKFAAKQKIPVVFSFRIVGRSVRLVVQVAMSDKRGGNTGMRLVDFARRPTGSQRVN